MELTLLQITVIGLVATVLSVVLRFVFAKLGVELGKGWMSAVAYVTSIILAVAFLFPTLELPTGGDPAEFVATLLALASSVLGFATLIYNVLLDRLLTKLNLTSERFLPQG